MSASPSRPRVLYYAHDHGLGHLHHAARAAGTGAFDLTVATSAARAAEVLPAATGLHLLPSDVVPGHRQPSGSRLHYTPTGPVIRDRFAALLDAARTVRPDVAVVDVSVETALFLRLAGYPVIHRRMHGDRTDPAHELVYAESDHLIAHYGAGLEEPGWRERFGAKTTFLGAPDASGRLGRRAGPRTGAASAVRTASPEITVVTGTGGGGVRLADLARAAGQVPGARWHVYGPVRGADGAVPPNMVLHGWTDDVAGRMRAADLVVVSAGYSAVADATEAARPLVLAPEERPFDEQDHFAAAAQAAAGVPWCRWGDESADWAGAVETALRDPAAADRLAAEVLTEPREYRRRWEAAVGQVLG
ncbi:MULTISPECIES: glycosyltransferase [Citricoccus]|uniref:glycosyltransferase n=1 Tax=Citricoccus TaxID=169133 RepID=UPI000255F758|nr:glycosyltransferase [Citricoccus sp. CH26A]